MPAATPLLGLPYPTPTDPADVPADIQALATKLDARPSALAAALPASPVDGQTWDYLADATAGVVWRFRYRAGSTSPYKWECVGGAPITAMSFPAQTQTLATASTWYDVASSATLAPTLVNPFAGDWDCQYEININPSTVGTIRGGAGIGVATNGPADGSTGTSGNVQALGQLVYLSARRRCPAIAANQTWRARLRGEAANWNLVCGWVALALFPVRVG